MTAISFWQGRRLLQVTPEPKGTGYLGLCNGRVVAKAPDPAGVVRAMVLSSRWRQ